MGAIFISYRRDDAEGQAGRLYDDLVSRFGDNQVFMDVAGIDAGTDFRVAIDKNIASCSVLLALIGKDWINAKDAENNRRLDNPNDFVRLEIASALKRDIPVIPVLVRDAAMPRSEQLPIDCQNLIYRNGVELSHARWDSDVNVLINALIKHIEETKPVSSSQQRTDVQNNPSKTRKWLTGTLMLAAVIGAGIAISFLPDRSPVRPAKNITQIITSPNQTPAVEIDEPRRVFYVCKLDPNGDNFLSLRAGPDSSSQEIKKLGPNSRLKILHANGLWLFAKTLDGTTGWVFSRWVCPVTPVKQ